MSRLTQCCLSALLACLIATAALGQRKAPAANTPNSRLSQEALRDGLTYVQQGRTAEARAAFEKAVKLNAANAEAQNALGQILLRENDVPGAIVHLRAVARLRPNLAIAHAYLAQALESNQQLDEAITELRVAIHLAPNEPDAGASTQQETRAG